ncbi:hypothetical protein FWG76_00355 [Candidatus Saccharibacteria bacterium]|nr:hypothetical protein [Candidatus Saccharibacteria bacterium]
MPKRRTAPKRRVVSKLPLRPLQPPVCQVGERKKIIYNTELEAEVAARNAEIDHSLPPGYLDFYQCEYAPHYHLRRA